MAFPEKLSHLFVHYYLVPHVKMSVHFAGRGAKNSNNLVNLKNLFVVDTRYWMMYSQYDIWLGFLEVTHII
jgi:hypothetical protein